MPPALRSAIDSVEQGRTREAHMEYVAAAKPAENETQWEKGHFWMDTN